MEIYAKGQLSYLILNCLLERDFYGLDIITEVKERSGGRISLKKPSVYSNLTRMEKQGQVSSYVKNSDLGPNRRYYSITDKGRATYAELKDYFDRNNVNVFDFVDEDDAAQPQEVEQPLQPQVESPVQEQEDDFFDFSSFEQPAAQEPVKEAEPQTEEPKPVQESWDFKQETKSDDGSFLQQKPAESATAEPVKKYTISSLLHTEEQEPQKETEDVKPVSNQEIHAFSVDAARRKRSFAEDQMAFAVSDPLAKDDEKTKANIEELKTSLLENKGKYNTRMSQQEFYSFRPFTQQKEAEPEPAPQKQKDENDDGVFITGTGAYSQMSARKIEPPKLKIIGEREPLPAPKKDNNIDISHKEIISKLYSKSKGAEQAQVDGSQYIYDYDDLQDYYSTQGVSFRVYEKTVARENHNTNKLNLFTSLICCGLSVVVTVLMFTLFFLTGNTSDATYFVYLLLPVAAVAEVCYRFYAYKNHTSWEPKPLWAGWLIWLITLLALGADVGLNFVFGLGAQSFSLFCTTLFVPAAYILIYIPLYYYIKKSLYVKLWR